MTTHRRVAWGHPSISFVDRAMFAALRGKPQGGKAYAFRRRGGIAMSIAIASAVVRVHCATAKASA